MSGIKDYLNRFLGDGEQKAEDGQNKEPAPADLSAEEKLRQVTEPVSETRDQSESILPFAVRKQSEEPPADAEGKMPDDIPHEEDISSYGPAESLILEKTDYKNQLETAKKRKRLISDNSSDAGAGSATVTLPWWLLVVWAVILVVLCVIISFVVARGMYRNQYFTSESDKVRFHMDNTDNYTLVKLQSVIDAVESVYYPGVDKNVVAEGAIQGIVNALGDQYTVYYRPGTMDKYREMVNGRYEGIGAVVRSCEKGLEITEVYADGPAMKAGIRRGDILTAINGETTVAMTAARLAELTGTGGTQLTLSYINGEGEMNSASVTVETISVQSVFTSPEGEGIYRVIITGFDSDTANEFHDKVTEIIGKGCRAMILDLRNNGGGYEAEASKIADMILPSGVIATARDKTGRIIKEIKSEESSLDMPIVVLINGRTASASELLAGAIKDFGAGKLVGTQTYGKALGQISVAFDSDGSGLVITNSCYYTPSGNCIQGKGILPDFHSDVPEEYRDAALAEIPENEDAPLQKAMELLTAELS